MAAFLSENLRHYNGLPVECVIADTTIGGVAEAAQTAEKFRREGVGVSLTVTPAWCYGSETMDMDPLTPKAVWGFNGTERPGAVYLAAVSAAHNQKGLPVFNIYGREVQDAGDTEIPDDVQEKLLRFARAGLAVADMRGNSYLSMGGTSMGIGGSILDQPFLQKYLGMRSEVIDMVEFVRRMERGIYDPDEFEQALAWTKENCQEGKDYNAEDVQQSRAEKDAAWETSVKMALIARDLMVGNPRLAELGYGEEAQGHNAIASGFQGQRQWTDHLPNGDFLEAILNSSFDWTGIRAAVHRGDGERLAERHFDAARASADEHGADLCRRAHVLEPRFREAGHRVRDDGEGCGRHSAPDQLRAGDAGRYGAADAGRQAGDEAVLGDQRRGSGSLSGCDELASRRFGLLPRRRLVDALHDQAARCR